MNLKRTSAAMAAAMALAACLLQAGEALAQARPKVALVLGGGGAKGAAHVGVIKVLEEMRIPVDCIAGTSMGALVGGAYATGMSAAELEKLVTGVRWQDTFTGVAREERPVNRKKYDFLFTIGLEIGISDKVRTAGGLVPSQQIEEILRRIAARSSGVGDFSSLPIPYRAVATDILKGEVAVLERGDLGAAMRASMAVPGAFAPVTIGDKVLVDGMLVRNLPVDVGRKLCGDVVIAVSLASPPPKAEDMSNVLAVIGQAINLGTDLNERAQLATLGNNDIAVIVPMGTMGAGDFQRVPEAIPLGEQTARALAPQLKRLSLSPEAYAAWRAGLGTATVATGEIGEVVVTGTRVVNPAVIEAQIRSRPGEPYDPAKASDDANRIYGRGDYERVDYRFGEPPRRLQYHATEKSWGPNYLMFDLSLLSDFQGDSTFSLRADYQRRWLNSLGGEWRTSVQIGRPLGLVTELYQPIDAAQRFFVAPSAYYYRNLSKLYSGEDSVAEYKLSRYGVTLDAGAALDTWGEARLGIDIGSLDATREVGTLNFPDVKGVDRGAFTGRFVYDSLNQAYFPTRGSYGLASAYVSSKSLGADDAYQRLSVYWQTVFSWHRSVVSASLEGGTPTGSTLPNYDLFSAGGPFRLSGLSVGQLRGQEYAIGVVNFRHRIAEITEALGSSVYAGATLEAGNVYKRPGGSEARGPVYAGSLYLGVDTRIGPAYLALGAADTGQYAIYLFIGSPAAAGLRGQ
jgi:NTE family protein